MRSKWTAMLMVIGLLPAAALAKEKPLRVPTSSKKATWVQKPLKKTVGSWIGECYVEAFGEKVAVASCEVAGSQKHRVYLGYHRDHGVAALKMPGRVEWVGLDGKDRFFAAKKDGSLFYAEDLHKTFKKISKVPKATDWDAAGGTIAAVARAQVWISVDGGNKFKKVGPTKAEIERVFVRYDDVVVADALGDWPYVTKDAGRSWKHPDLEGYLSPRRYGSFIADGGGFSAGSFQGKHEVMYFCGQGMLADDGETWVGYGDGPAFRRYKHWKLPFATTDSIRAYGSIPFGTASDPPPPSAKNESAKDAIARCEANPEHYFGHDRRGGGGMGTMGGWGRGGCEGTKCLGVPRLVEETRTVFTLFSDGACAESERPSPDRAHRCAASAPLTRTPTAAIIDLKTHKVRTSKLPNTCTQPTHLENLNGAALLVCADEEKIHLADAKGRWHPQSPESFNPRNVDCAHAAADGTIVLMHGCLKKGSACRTLVRKPGRLQDRGDWREVAVKGAGAYRAAPRGAVLAIVPALTSTTSKCDLRGSDIDGEMDGFDIYQDLQKHIGKMAECHGKRRTPGLFDGVGHLTFTIGPDGDVVDAAPAGFGDEGIHECLAGVIKTIRFYRPGKKPTKVKYWMGMQALVQSVALVLDDGKPRTLAEQVKFEDGLWDVGIKPDGRLLLVTKNRVGDDSVYTIGQDSNLIPLRRQK